MRSIFAIALVASCPLLLAAKPPGGGPAPTPNAEIAYRLPSGKAVKLVFADENGANITTVYTSPTSFRFDLAPRGQNEIAITAGSLSSSKLLLLTYTPTTFGTYETDTQELTSARSGSNVDFSPDGNKIAFACCSDGTNETLAVYDLNTGTVTPWATAPYFWDFTWFRNGASIAYSTLGPVRLYEVAGPNAGAQLLYSGQGELNVDSSRLDPDKLVLSYNDASGNARIGFWKDGAFVDPDLANSGRSWFGTVNCNDSKLAYGGVQNNSGSQAYYIRDLTSGSTTLISRNSNVMPQFWPTCG